MTGLILRFLGGTVLDRLLAHMERRVDSETSRQRISADLAAEHIRAEINARAEARKVLLAETGFFWSASRLGRLAFVMPLAVWWAAVCVDSVFHFNWRIAEVPVLRDWGGIILAALFLSDGVQRLGRTWQAGR